MNRRWRQLSVLAAGLLALIIGVSGAAVAARAKRTELKAGWFHWDPYQFESERQDVLILEGLDIQLLRAVFKHAGFTIGHQQTTLEELLDAVKTGRLDLASGVSYTDERAAYAWFSEPYRSATDVLIVPKHTAATLTAASAPGLFQAIGRNKDFRLGVVRGFHYGPDADPFLNDAAHATQIRYSLSDNESLEKLIDGSLDGFLADRLVADTLAWHAGMAERIEEHPVPVFSWDVRVMFSKATSTQAAVAAFNDSLRQIRASGEYNRIARHYLVPLLLKMTLERPWFAVLGLIGTIAFALSGVLLARKEHYSIFGAFVLAALPAVGGGALRDVLTERHPLGILRTSQSLIAVLITVFAGAVFYRLVDARRNGRAGPRGRGTAAMNAVELCDALGLAAFTVTGVVIAVEQRCEPLWLWGTLLAVMTGAGGGILRDTVRSDPNSSNLKSGFYAEIAGIWGLGLSLFLTWETSRLGLREVAWGVAVTMLGTFVTRLLVVRYGIQSWNMGMARADQTGESLRAQVGAKK